MIALVGSGPAAFGVAIGLIDRGVSFQIIDIGKDLDSNKLKLKHEFQQTSEPEDLKRLKSLLSQTKYDTKNPIGQKALFGDTFPYGSAQDIEFKGTSARPSSALGGFSRVWGSTMLPFSNDVLRNWPGNISIPDLIDGYERISKLVPITGSIDNLGSCYFDVEQIHQPLEIDSNSLRIHQSLVKRNDRHMVSGRARLAVSSKCDSCQLCITGCPRDAIWSSDVPIRELQEEHKFTYTSGVDVKSFVESDAEVTLLGTKNGNDWKESFAHVILATGPISTASILVRSNWQSEIVIRDSQTVFVPAIDFLARDIRKEQYATLAHTLTTVNEVKSNRTVHAQFYGWNNSIPSRIISKLEFIKFFPRRILERLTMKLGAVIVYFDSFSSGYLRVCKDADSKVVITAVPPTSTSELKKCLKRTFKQLRIPKFYPLLAFSEFAKVGEGYHSGASIPMGNPEVGTDEFGRPNGLSRITVADSSILPDIPAGPLTFTVMANAYRIAATSPVFATTL